MGPKLTGNAGPRRQKSRFSPAEDSSKCFYFDSCSRAPGARQRPKTLQDPPHKAAAMLYHVRTQKPNSPQFNASVLIAASAHQTRARALKHSKKVFKRRFRQPNEPTNNQPQCRDGRLAGQATLRDAGARTVLQYGKPRQQSPAAHIGTPKRKQPALQKALAASQA